MVCGHAGIRPCDGTCTESSRLYKVRHIQTKDVMNKGAQIVTRDGSSDSVLHLGLVLRSVLVQPGALDVFPHSVG